MMAVITAGEFRTFVNDIRGNVALEMSRRNLTVIQLAHQVGTTVTSTEQFLTEGYLDMSVRSVVRFAEWLDRNES